MQAGGAPTLYDAVKEDLLTHQLRPYEAEGCRRSFRFLSGSGLGTLKLAQNINYSSSLT